MSVRFFSFPHPIIPVVSSLFFGDNLVSFPYIWGKYLYVDNYLNIFEFFFNKNYHDWHKKDKSRLILCNWDKDWCQFSLKHIALHNPVDTCKTGILLKEGGESVCWTDGHQCLLQGENRLNKYFGRPTSCWEVKKTKMVLKTLGSHLSHRGSIRWDREYSRDRFGNKISSAFIRLNLRCLWNI